MMKNKLTLIIFLVFWTVCLSDGVRQSRTYCDKVVSPALRKEISSYRPIVASIIVECLRGNFTNATWDELALFTDTFGSRMSGSDNLEKSIDFLINKLKEYNLENVHDEKVNVSHWVRGQEEAFVTTPRGQKMRILGLGGSVGTPPDGIWADVLVVQSFEELQHNANQTRGKIVVILRKSLKSSTKELKYQNRAVSEVASLGGVAVLVRSSGEISYNTLHMDQVQYGPKSKVKIPIAVISAQDADMLLRIARRGTSIKIYFRMTSQNLPMFLSRNIVGEIKGSEWPEKAVIVAAPLDTWDLGQGALDGSRAFESWASLAVLQRLGLRPRRTVRVVLFTGEKQGLYGAKAYKEAHKSEIPNYQAMIESAFVAFNPRRLQHSRSLQSDCIVQEIVKLFNILGTITLIRTDQRVGDDIKLWQGETLLLSKIINNHRYCSFRDTDLDTMLVLNSKNLDRTTALFAAMTYVLGQLSVDLPKTGNTTTEGAANKEILITTELSVDLPTTTEGVANEEMSDTTEEEYSMIGNEFVDTDEDDYSTDEDDYDTTEEEEIETTKGVKIGFISHSKRDNLNKN